MSLATRARALKVVSPAPRLEWLDVLEADADALVTQTPEWLDSMCASGPYEDASRLYYTTSGHRLVLPMVRVRHLPKPVAIEASFPASWGMGGLLAEGFLGSKKSRGC